MCEHKTKFTNAGNCHLRRLAVEVVLSYKIGIIGQKSAELKKSQKDMPSDLINYSDKASMRCQRKYYRLTKIGKDSNKAITAVARELCCFRGMATSHFENRASGTLKGNSGISTSSLD